MINRTSDSDSKKLKQVLSQEELGDRTPTQFLRKLQQLLGERAANFDQDLLKELFMHRMPQTVRSILVKSTASLDEQANLADKIIESLDNSNSVSSINNNCSSSSTDKRIEAIENQLKELLSITQRSRSYNQSFNNKNYRNRSRSRSKSRFSPKGRFCYYHFKFRDQANKCVQPCSYEQRKEQKN